MSKQSLTEEKVDNPGDIYGEDPAEAHEKATEAGYTRAGWTLRRPKEPSCMICGAPEGAKVRRTEFGLWRITVDRMWRRVDGKLAGDVVEDETKLDGMFVYEVELGALEAPEGYLAACEPCGDHYAEPFRNRIQAEEAAELEVKADQGSLF